MPFLQPPAVWMPGASSKQENKILRAIYARISANRGTPISQFIIDNPNYKSFYIQHEFL